MLWWDNRSALPSALAGSVTSDAHGNVASQGSLAGEK
jgi:hypothetical protein